MDKKNSREYSLQYHKENLKQYKFNLSLIHDADLIEFLDSVPNKQGYIKDLIRHDMAARPMRGDPQTKTGDDYPTGNE